MLQSLSAVDLGIGAGAETADQIREAEERRRKSLLKVSDTSGQPMLGPGSLAASMLGLASADRGS